MEKTWTFGELTQRWSDLEPEQCRHVGANNYEICIPIDSDHQMWALDFDRLGHVDLALILDRILTLAESRDIRLALENHQGGWLATIGRLNGELKVLHAKRGKGEQAIATLEAYVSFLGWEAAQPGGES